MSADRVALLRDLQRRVTVLEDDLRERLSSPDGSAQRLALEDEHRRALEVERTSVTWGEYRDEQVTQAAVAWVLATVFARFCEDNHLIPDPWIAGPGERTRLAAERQQAFLVASPLSNDRDWLEQTFAHLADYPALASLFDVEHNPLHRLAVSADQAESLIAFWRTTDETGQLVHDFTDPELSTRFLGDLYQDLSASARARFALLQTPDFVEEFILDRTMEPALAERPLKGFRMIDPTCGSGHFVLGAFDRLFDRWSREVPGLDLRERVRRALDGVHGVDLNPFAVAIARFRLTVAALRASGLTRLVEAPGYTLHLAVGDSLLHRAGQQTLAEDTDLGSFTYGTEDLGQLQQILTDGRYDAVVGNPPYIIVKDSALNAAYRRRYRFLKGKYALTVPFMERFFALSRSTEKRGWVGMITSNSFMKREFGAPIIEKFLGKLDLKLVADTSGAYIPGHGTPTVILVGRNSASSSQVPAVLGRRGEPGRPEAPERGLVWRSIVDHVDDLDYENEWVTVSRLDRDVLSKHPWSLSGGGAVELLDAIVSAGTATLSSRIESVGFAAITGDDGVFAPGAPPCPHCWQRDQVPVRPFVEGDRVRDWALAELSLAAFPYTGTMPRPGLDRSTTFWPYRSTLRSGLAFGRTREDAGRAWYEYILPNWSRLQASSMITFAFVTTHNHFVLVRGGKVFKQSAPVIKLPAGASEDDHLALLGVLNSSTACFWLKQNSHNKGRPGAEAAGADEPWEHRFEFTGTTIADFPLPGSAFLDFSRQMDSLGRHLETLTPGAVCSGGIPTASTLDAARQETLSIRGKMIALQEELDWAVYAAYGLVDDLLAPRVEGVPELASEQRPFAIVMARQMEEGLDTSWFSHWNHRFEAVTDIPKEWPPAYRDVVQSRLDVIESDPRIAILEKPEHKRRWATEPWEKEQERALRDWLLTRLEQPSLWRDGAGRPQWQSVSQLAERVSVDAELLGVLELWSGRPGADVAAQLSDLLADEHVPYLAALRYKPSGLRKREQWEQTWELQRAEDRGEKVGVIPVPQKYTTADFVKTSYWRHRGKLDVPKERFISYPGAERGADQTLVLGWAGWDHSEQAQALAGLAVARAQREGWQADQLTPLLAGLAELEPWLRQWHADIDPRMGVSPAQAMTGTLERELARLGLTRTDLARWSPPAAVRGRRRRTTQEA